MELGYVVPSVTVVVAGHALYPTGRGAVVGPEFGDESRASADYHITIGNYDKGLKPLLAILEPEIERFHTLHSIGRGYLAANDFGNAVKYLEKARNWYFVGRIQYPINSIDVHYYLGLAYEKSGWNREAKEQYEFVLAKLKNADTGMSLVTKTQEAMLRVQ